MIELAQTPFNDYAEFTRIISEQYIRNSYSEYITASKLQKRKDSYKSYILRTIK